MNYPEVAVEIGAEVIARLISMVEKGETLPWNRPWKAMGLSNNPVNPTTGRAYSGGFNVFTLTVVGGSFGDLRFAGAKQWEAAGNPIKKGEKGFKVLSPLFRCKTCNYSVQPSQKACKNGHETSENGQSNIKMAGYSNFTVFNNQQGENPLPFPESIQVDPNAGNEKAAKILKQSGADVIHGGDVACYTPSEDRIRMPLANQFDSVSDYWATMMHELVHWTGGQNRLKRPQANRFGTPAYAYEELIAEIGSALLCNQLEIVRPGLDEQHTAYLQSWLKGVKDKPHSLYMAAVEAQKAVKLLTK